MALTTGIAVVAAPSRGSSSGSIRTRERGVPRDVDDIAVFDRPVRGHGVAELPDRPALEPRSPVSPASDGALDTGDTPIGDGHEAEVKVVVGDGEVDAEADLVEIQSERGCHHHDLVAERATRSLDRSGGLGISGIAVDSHRPEHRPVGIPTHVDGLEDRELLDPLRHGCSGKCNHRHMPGVDATRVERRVATFCSGRNMRSHVVAVPIPGQHVQGRHDVATGFENADDVVDVGPVWRVDDAIGLKRDECADVVGGGNSDRVDPAQLPNVAAHLVGRPGITADEAHCWMTDESTHGGAAGLPCGPLHDT